MDVSNYTTEEWRDVVGYEGIYSVSNLGRVRRDKPYATTHVGRILPWYVIRNYPMVQLCNKGQKKLTVHKLVAEAFIGPRPQGYTVNHKDGNKMNPCADNLEYCTPKENLDHAKQIGLMDTRGIRNGRAKLTEDDVRLIRSLYIPRHPEFNGYALARRFSVAKNTIDQILKRTNWKHID